MQKAESGVRNGENRPPDAGRRLPDARPMGRYGLRFHHLGLAVGEPELARKFLAALGYEVGEPAYDPRQHVNLIMCRSSHMPDVEVVYPAAEPGPLDGILRRRQDGLYHMCYQSRDVEKSLGLMRQDGHRLIPLSSPQPAVLFEGQRVSFYQLVGVGLIELIDAGEHETEGTL